MEEMVIVNRKAATNVTDIGTVGKINIHWGEITILVNLWKGNNSNNFVPHPSVKI